MTNLPLTIIEFILVLGVMLFLHEFGHYLVSLICGVEVEEFGIGFPPRMVKLFTWKGTDFTLNWLPFGAFVRPKGENDPEIPGGLGAANPWKRLAVLFAGPAMNILTGFLVFVILFMELGAPNMTKVEVAEISTNSPAAAAGLQAGDIVTRLNGQSITSVEQLQTTVKQYLDQKITLDIQRGSQNLSVTLTPRSNPPEGQGAIGFAITYPYEPVSLGQALPEAGATTWAQIKSIVVTPVQLITGKLTGDQARFVGPVGIFDIYQTAKTRDTEAAASPVKVPAVNVLLFIATISLALGITNLLPIPALDGGRILFVIPELILRKRVPAEFENYVHMIGFAALLLLMVYITMQDIINPITLK
jgi:regulator of sigma E protease